MTRPPANAELLDLGRAAYAGQAWNEAADRLAEADSVDELVIEDLERLATALHLAGRPVDAARVWERAHRMAVAAGDPCRAARHAFHLVMGFSDRGEMSQAGGWMSRAMGLVEGASDCVEGGYLLIPQGIRAVDSGDGRTALATFEQVAEIAERFADPDLMTFGRLGRGNAWIALGERERGLALLDEAMIAVTAGEVSPITAGIVYCASIEAFRAVFDLRRAQEWTAALARWCDSQPDLVPFRGRCLVYRAELLVLHGHWRDAIAEAQRAHDWMSRPPIEPAIGEAFYQRAELHRLRGEAAEAEGAYRDASKWGRPADPGLALLRLAQGDAGAALAMLRRAVDESDGRSRPNLLGPYADVLLATGDTASAAAVVTELRRLADESDSALLQAIATRCDGLVRLVAGDARGALAALRSAMELWRTLDAPYEAARTRVGIARACAALGDAETAAMELAAARDVFVELGAGPDVVGVDRLAGAAPGAPAAPAGLSGREVEVLRLLARGRTNREIAAELGISERTVDRHVSNVYGKIDVASRAAATAFAYERGLIEG